MEKIVKCCFNCKHYHFYSGICDKKQIMPPIDLKLPCQDFKEGGFKNESEISRRRNKS